MGCCIMGDMADWIIDNGYDEWMDFDPETYGMPDFDDAQVFPGPKRFSCKYCHKTGLVWRQFENGWRLTNDDGSIHKCKEYMK